MARVNVESDVLANPRFHALVRRCGGDLEKALGRLVRFWMAAQRHWGDDCGLIPDGEFAISDFEHLIEVGFAEKRPGGVYAKGSEKHFAWYLQKKRQVENAPVQNVIV